MTIDHAVSENSVRAQNDTGAALFDIGMAIALANGRVWALPHKQVYAFYISYDGKLRQVASLSLDKEEPLKGRLTYYFACNGQEIPKPSDVSGTTDEIAAAIVEFLMPYLEKT